MKFNLKSVVLASGLFFGALSNPALAHGTSDLTLTEIVASSGGEFDRNGKDFDILLNAVLAANLQDALSSSSADLTVFAPNDKAFIRLARDLGFEGGDEEGAFAFIVEVLTELGEGDPIGVLTNILLYHVSDEAKSLTDVLESEQIDTLLAGESIVPFRFRLLDNEPELKDPRFSFRTVNLRASNGIIHGINRVLIPVDLPNTPSGQGTITDIVAASGGDFDHNFKDFDILLNAVIAADLAGALSDENADLTVFAPNDAAFVRLARNLGYHGYDEQGAFDAIVMALTELGQGDPIPLLTDILLYHVSAGSQPVKQVLQSEEIATLLDGAFFEAEGRVLIDNDTGLRNPRIKVSESNIRADNGIIHTISRILIPVQVTSH